MDFFNIKERSPKPGIIEVYPDFKVCRSKDLMVRGRSFYAIWDEERGLWSTDEYDVPRLVDKELWDYKEKIRDVDAKIVVKTMANFSSRSWVEFRNYMSNISDSNNQLDETLTFQNTVVKKTDYVSKRLSYPLEAGSFEAYNEIIGTLYDEDERAKLEWAIGSIVAGDSKDIQKFIVLYGEAGAGKSTILNIIQKLFDGYYTTFEAKALTSSNNAFSTEVFKENPLVGIQHDGDLSKIEDNSKFNSIISHEEMTMNEKYKPSYTARTDCFLFMATNRPVKITDAKSGIIRRLIDVKPSGNKIPSKRYHTLMSQIDFELGAIASHCLEVYKDMGKNYYASYRPIGMIFQTDVFFNFVESNYEDFKAEDGVSLSRAYDMYKAYCEDSLVEFKLARHKFREELKNYFEFFDDITRVDGKQVRSYYHGFLSEKFVSAVDTAGKSPEPHPSWLMMDGEESLFDEVYADRPAQYATEEDKPVQAWAEVQSKLSDLDTSRVHYVQVPEKHITIDFDLRDAEGNKSSALNLEAASKWPPTYAEFSKSGAGIHLEYIYDGDTSTLSRIFSEGIEVKIPVGGSALRRRLTKCNSIPITTINSGIPLRGAKMVNFDGVKTERTLRNQIDQNLRKEVHAGTASSVSFIHKILDDAYSSGLKYDVTDLRPRIFAFACNSTHQADTCVKLVGKMKFKSEEVSAPKTGIDVGGDIVFFDVEVFPNLFLVNWKLAGPEAQCVHMFNPSSKEIEKLLGAKLIGFNCRRYDNHILYARYVGYDNQQLYMLSQRIINSSPNAMIGEAYNVSYTDVYDFASAGNKKSLKKFEIELGIHHQELGFPWDQPVPEDKWHLVADYCDNDVIATEAVFNHLAGDWTARRILAEVAGMTVNDTTNSLTTKIIFGDDRKPQRQFNYRDMGAPLETGETYWVVPDCDPEYSVFVGNRPMFPGYKFDAGKSLYRGEEAGEGGYVYAEPGIHHMVAVMDVASMHPTSIVTEQLFGVYTKRFEDILDARIAIKHRDFDTARKMLDGKLAPYLNDEAAADDLSLALKTAINSVYGLTAARFENPFRDPRNKDNIVAKRGALFMINLKHEVQDRGFVVAHIKTDSIKIPNATPEILDFVFKYGQAYGYTFEHECTYDRMCLVNDAVYIARYDKEGIRTKRGKHANEWTATGAQFAQPYVFKTLFSQEPVVFEDMCETKSVTTALYLDMNERFPNVDGYAKELEKLEKKLNDEYPGVSSQVLNEMSSRADELRSILESAHDYHFVGKAGSFCPIKPGCGGGVLLRENKGKYNAAGGSKGYRWLEAEAVKLLGKEEDIDTSYYDAMVDEAVAAIEKHGSFERFVSDKPPWELPCGKMSYDKDCAGCPEFVGTKCKFERLPF